MSSEKIVWVAKELGIDPTGKGEEELRRQIVQVLQGKPGTESSESSLAGISRTLGRIIAEYNKTKAEFEKTFNESMQVVKSVQEPFKLTASEIEKTLQAARNFGVTTQGKTVSEISAEVRRVRPQA